VSARILHEIPPFFEESSRILVLGSFPSVKSREAGFFYHHPQNRFWKVLAAVFGEEVPADIPEKFHLLRKHHIALWDVIASCEIQGSSDSSIRNVKPNDIGKILTAAPVRAIFVNGGAAYALYRKYLEKILGRPGMKLPSTSPANAAWSLERLTESWKILAEYAGENHDH